MLVCTGVVEESFTETVTETTLTFTVNSEDKVVGFTQEATITGFDEDMIEFTTAIYDGLVETMNIDGMEFSYEVSGDTIKTVNKVIYDELVSEEMLEDEMMSSVMADTVEDAKAMAELMGLTCAIK